MAVVDIKYSSLQASNYVFFSNFSRDSDSFPRTVHKAPKTVGTVTVVTLNCLLTSAAKSCTYQSFLPPFL